MKYFVDNGDGIYSEMNVDDRKHTTIDMLNGYTSFKFWFIVTALGWGVVGF